jgi:hypothetical protein
MLKIVEFTKVILVKYRLEIKIFLVLNILNNVEFTTYNPDIFKLSIYKFSKFL